MKIKKMKNSKTTNKKWELKMKEKEPLQCWIVNIMSSKNRKEENKIHMRRK
jgi:hypothetical protein